MIKRGSKVRVVKMDNADGMGRQAKLYDFREPVGRCRAARPEEVPDPLGGGEWNTGSPERCPDDSVQGFWRCLDARVDRHMYAVRSTSLVT